MGRNSPGRKGCSKPGEGKLAVEDQIINISVFAGHTVWIAATQLCCYREKSAVNNT